MPGTLQDLALTPPDPSPRHDVDTSRNLSLARHLGLSSSIVFCLLLPITMVVANKSAPAALVLGALLANGSVLAAGRAAELRARYLQLLRTGWAWLLIALVVVSVLSLLWSIAVPMTLRGLSETLPELVFGWAAAAAWPMVAKPRDVRLLAFGVAGAALLIVFEAATGMPLHKLVRARALVDDLKRSSVPPLFLLWPAFLLCRKSGRPSIGWALVGLAAIGGIAAHASSTVVGVLLGVAVLFLAERMPRLAITGFVATILCLLVAAPWTGSLATRFLSSHAQTLLAQQHATQRKLIWNAFERHVWERPLLGHGFDTSFRIATVAITQNPAFGPMEEEAVFEIHPHNQLLQMWIDLGLLGAAIVTAALALTARALWRMSTEDLAPQLAFLAGAAIIAIVGVQAWDAWWLASIVTTQLAFAAVRLAPPHSINGPVAAGG